MKHLKEIESISEITPQDYLVIYTTPTEVICKKKEQQREIVHVVYVDGSETDFNIEGSIYGTGDVCNPTPTQQITNVQNAKEIYLSNKITEIGNLAFCGGVGAMETNELVSIDLYNTVTSIGNGAFQNCRKLTSIKSIKGVTSIGYCAFTDCEQLTSIELSNNLTYIGYMAFQNTNLSSIELPNSIENIGFQAFALCRNLASVKYNGVTYTSKSELETALTNNGVTFGFGVFIDTALSD